MSNIMSFAKIAVRNLFSEPATVGYPFEPKEYPERTRGHIEIDADNCILCGMCMRSCPPGAIKVDRPGGKWSINGYDCVQCGYCVEKCPKKCLDIVAGYTTPAGKKEIREVDVEVPPPPVKKAPAKPAEKKDTDKKESEKKEAVKKEADSKEADKKTDNKA